MPFERVGKLRGATNPELVTMAVNKNEKSKSLIIHIGSDISTKAGFKLDERAECLWGYDDDVGIMMLAKPEEEGVGVKWKDNLPRLTHATTRVPEWVLPFRMTEAEVVSIENGEVVLKLPKEDEIIKRAPLAASDIKRPAKKTTDPKITVTHKDGDQPQPPQPDPTPENTFTREVKSRRRPDRFQGGRRA